jgi:hypothetical protein
MPFIRELIEIFGPGNVVILDDGCDVDADWDDGQPDEAQEWYDFDPDC